jgi:DNA sulfur modification protein DndD
VEKTAFSDRLPLGAGKRQQPQLPIAIDTPLSRLDSSHRRNLIDQYFPHAAINDFAFNRY